MLAFLLLTAALSLTLVVYFAFLSIRERFYAEPNKALIEAEQHHTGLLNTYMDRSLLFLNEYLYTLPLPSMSASESPVAYMYRLLEFEKLSTILTSDLDSAFASDPTFCVFVENFPYGSTMHISSMNALDEGLRAEINAKPFAQIHFSPRLLELSQGGSFLVFYRNFNRSVSRNIILRTAIPYKAIDAKLAEINRKSADFQVVHLIGQAFPETNSRVRVIRGEPMADGSAYTVEINKGRVTAAALLPLGVWAVFALGLCITLIYMQKQIEEDLEHGLSQFINRIDSIAGDLPAFEAHGGSRFTGRIYTLLQSQLIRRQESEILRMQLIQERMNPHLLYNVLASLKAGILRYEDAKLAELIDVIGHFFRASLKKGEELSSINDEIRMARDYIYIINELYGKSILLDVQISGSFGGSLILRHIIQPIVENSVTHGFKDMPTGTITITGGFREDCRILTIADDGCGMAASTVQALQSGSFSSDSESNGYAMRNMHRRMKIFYGPLAHISVFSTLGAGSSVRLYF
jgi:signal transduction histidine kinase